MGHQYAPLSLARLTLLMYSEQPSSHEMPNLYVVLLGTVMKPARHHRHLSRVRMAGAVLRFVVLRLPACTNRAFSRCLEQLAHAAATREPSEQATGGLMLVTADDSPNLESAAAATAMPTAVRNAASDGRAHQLAGPLVSERHYR